MPVFVTVSNLTACGMWRGRCALELDTDFSPQSHEVNVFVAAIAARRLDIIVDENAAEQIFLRTLQFIDAPR